MHPRLGEGRWSPARRGKLGARGDPAAPFFFFANRDENTICRKMYRSSNHRRSRFAAGFTLVEALVAISIAAIAGSVLLLGITSSFQTTNEALERTIAAGMAEQLMDEIVGCRYVEAGDDPGSAVPGLDEGEYTEDESRQEFDDVDDYIGFPTGLPEDRWGVKLGADDGEGGLRHENFRAPDKFFEHWRQEISIYYLDESDPATRLPAGQVSRRCAIEVRILHEDPDRGTRELAGLRRVVAYVPPM
jgi:type II secretory pathway pseudopilin PulG